VTYGRRSDLILVNVHAGLRLLLFRGEGAFVVSELKDGSAVGRRKWKRVWRAHVCGIGLRRCVGFVLEMGRDDGLSIEAVFISIVNVSEGQSCGVEVHYLGKS
jgi:hypothetical protein